MEHPLFVRQVPETPAPGHTIAPDPGLVAAQLTAQYTLDLAIATFVLFGGTILALVVGEIQRRLGLKDLREVRAKEAEAKRIAGLSQLITILQAYERAINLLLMAPNYPIRAHTRTMETLFAHSLGEGIVSAIPVELRNTVLTAVVKAQETLQAAVENQGFYDSMRAELEREGSIMARFAERLKEADDEVKGLLGLVAREGDTRTLALLQEKLGESQRRLSALKASPDAYDSEHFLSTSGERNEKLKTLYPTITTNAQDAKAVISAARLSLGDDTDVKLVPIADRRS